MYFKKDYENHTIISIKLLTLIYSHYFLQLYHHQNMQKLHQLYQKWHQQCPYTTNFFTIIGLLILAFRFFAIIKFIYATFLRSEKNLIKRYGQNSWVFITGSSDGIGKELAISFAKRGFNIILSARTLEKLEKVKNELIKINEKIQVKIINVDYANSNKENFFQPIYNQLKDLDISIIVNNVGVDVLDNYHLLDEQVILDLITINCIPTAVFCRKFIPILKQRKHKSAIVNVGSVAGEFPISLHNVYSASKGYIDYLTKSLAYEFPEIDIICLRPSEVSTPMTFHKKLDIFTIKPNQCAQGLIKDLGYEMQTNGHWNHKLQSAFYSIVPNSLFNAIYLNVIGPLYKKQRKQAIEKLKKKS